MGLPLHFNTVSSTDGYYGVLLWLGVEVEPTIHQSTNLPHLLLRVHSTWRLGWGGSECFSKYLELFLRLSS